MFDIEIITSESGLGAVAVALPDAISTAELAVGQAMSPLIVQKGADGLEMVSNETEGIGNISDTWSPLLTKLKLFSELVDTFAEVGFHSYDYFRIK